LRNAPLSAKLPPSLLLLPGAGVLMDLIPRPLRRLFNKYDFTQFKVVYHPALLSREILDQSVRNSGIALAADVRKVVLAANIIHDLKRLQTRTLLIVGDHDLFVPLPDAQEFNSLIADSKLEVIEEAGHYSLLDNPVGFNAALESFLGSTSHHMAKDAA